VTDNVPLREGTEFDLVRRLLARWGAVAQHIGDDAAVLSAVSSGSLVVSTDTAVENVDFRRGWLDPREIGYRATAGALSDLAAMAATPIGILFALTLPDEWRKDIDAIGDGVGDAAKECATHVVGGDLSAGRDLSFTITVLGLADHPLRRSGATAGDRVYVTGELGGPADALAALSAGRPPSPEARARFAHPVPRIREAQWLANHGATAATDISDGLTADLSSIAAASGVSISLSLDRIPAIAGIDGRDAAESGEEYELIVTSRRGFDSVAFQNEFGIPLTEVGAVESGRPVVRVFDRGAPVPTPAGYMHFKR
jgi:thiamine-monophosphate kinase